MDTGDLSKEACRAIMIEAEMYHPDLAMQFGLLSSDCRDENNFVVNSIELISEMKDYDALDLNDMFFGNSPEMSKFHSVLKRILDNIVELKKIPTERRTYD